MADNHLSSEERWVDFETFCKAVGRPQLNVRFALQALGRQPRRMPENRRFTQYNLDWIDEVRNYLDQLGNRAYPGA